MRTNACPDFSREVHCLLGLPFDAIDLAEAEARIRSAAAERASCFMSTPNVNFLIGCRTDAAFRDSVVTSDLSVADGMPVVWLARLLGIPIRSRVAGASLFERLLGGSGEPLSVYFFGGSDGAAEAAFRRLAAGGLRCVGFAFPGYGSAEEMSSEEHIARINAARPDILVVALGARKGQAWIARNRARLNVPVISHLGAVLDFAAGRVRRAPAWMQDAGLEWLWRIKEQPALWRRYAVDGLVLARLLVTRALPYIWYRRRHAPNAAELAKATLRVKARTGRSILRLAGPWTGANLGRLRRALRYAALAGHDVSLELGEVTYVDSAFVGLLMVAEAHQRREGRHLVLASPSEAVQRVIRYCCAEYLLAGTAVLKASRTTAVASP